MKHILNIDLAKIKLDKGEILQVSYDDECDVFKIKSTKCKIKGFYHTKEKYKKFLSFKEFLSKYIL